MSWLTRNRISLIVIAVCVPSIIGVLFGFEVLSRNSKSTDVVEISVGDTAEADGYSWKLTESVEIAGEGRAVNDIPLGTSLVAAILTVTPVGASPGDSTCDVSLSSRSSGVEREWRTVSDVASFGYARLADSASYCSLDGQPFSLEVVFLTPSQTYDAATVDLDLGESDSVYRFDLKH